MSRVVSTGWLEGAELAATLQPRRGLVTEQPAPDGGSEGEGVEGEGEDVEGIVFEAVSGPVDGYRREVQMEPAADGRALVTQTVQYRLRIPYFGWVFALGFRRELGRLGAVPPSRWWSAPEPLDGQAFTVLGCLAALSVIVGYLSTLMTQTITFAAQEFHAGKAAQGVALAVVRGDIVLSVGLVALADRWGRRTIAVWATVLGSVLTAITALAPSLAALAGAQVVARGFVTATTITVSILAAEAMPRGSRAYALGLIAMASALGVGVAVVALPVADLGLSGWRLLFAAGVLGAPLALNIARRLPESRRYERAKGSRNRGTPAVGAAAAGGVAVGAAAAGGVAGGAAAVGGVAGGGVAVGTARSEVAGGRRRRLGLLGAALFLWNLFVVPASQFQNEYLRRERHYSAAHISLFTIVTVVPGALGIVIGGRLADTRGRRVVGAAAAAGGALGAVLLYLTAGWPMWVFSTTAAVVGTATIPALAVYGPELFATAGRGLANGLVNVAGRVGSVVGLVGVGVMASTFGRFGPAFAVVAAGPLAMAVLVLVAFPETAGRELEDLNPEDALS